MSKHPLKLTRDEIIELLKKGELNETAIAEMAGCKRQYVNQIKHDEMKKGVVFPGVRAPAGRKPRVAKGKPDVLLSLKPEDIDEVALVMYEWALKARALERTNNELLNIVAALKNENKLLQEQVDGLHKREQRVKLAKQQRGVYGESAL